MAKHQGDDAGEEVSAPPPSVGWTALAEAGPGAAAAGKPGIRSLLAGLLAYLRRVTPHVAGGRVALGRAVRMFHLPEITARSPAPAPPDRQAAEPPPHLPLDPDQIRARIDAVMALLPPRGDAAMPANLQALGRLLAETPPTDDFEAADLLHDCFPRGTRNSPSRVLMAIARNLSRHFGRAGRLPITSGKAWTMIDPELFADELAEQLADICDFVLGWQARETEFLILEFAEVELIEYLFENLHPRRHAGLLIKVMEFKVLSLRRMGLLRRIPARIRRRIHNAHGADPAGLRDYVNDTMGLLDYFARPAGFPAVSAAAQVARAEVEKIAAHLAAPSPSSSSPSAPEPLHPVMRGLGLPAITPPRQVTPPVAPPRRRFTRRQKTEAVMRLLQGEDRDWVALSLGVSPALLAGWQDAFLNGGSAALAPAGKSPAGPPPAGKPRSDGGPSVDELKDQLHALIKTVEQVKETLNPELTIHGIVLTMFDARNNLSGQVVADVREFMGAKVYDTVIPRNVRVSEAPSYGKPVLVYDLKCSGSEAYLRLATEIIQREKQLTERRAS